MKKILIANDLLKGGGVENVLESLVVYLREQGNEIHLMIPNCTQKEIDNFFGIGVKHCNPLCKKKDLRKYSVGWFIDRSFFVLKQQFYHFCFFIKQYDVLIALKEGEIKNTSSLYAKKKFAWVHTDYSVMHWTQSEFKSLEHERKCFRKFDKTICVSEAAKSALIQTIGDPENLCVKYNPINYKKIQEQAEGFCDLKKENNTPLFVSVGRLAYPKNYSLLIDVCNELTKKYSFEVWIVGDGPDRTELQKKIDEYDLSCIKLLGEKGNPFPYLEQADMFVSTSLVESYGLAIQEALVLEKPVIAVKCPAIEECFDDGFGILCEPTYQSLKDAIESVLMSPQQTKVYKSTIKEKYEKEDLYEMRLMAINSLWENCDE